jgi:transposase
MNFHAGIDVSLETSTICILDDEGTVLREAKVETSPEALIAVFKAFGEPLKRVGLEAGPLSPWLYKELRGAGYAAISVETRHMKSAASPI